MYIVIQSCFGYEKSLNSLLSQLRNFKIIEDIIVVKNKAQSHKVIEGQIIIIETPKNNFELSSFGEIYNNLNRFNKHDLFLFLHDTIELTEEFPEKLKTSKKDLNLCEFDYAFLADNFQSAIGFAKRKFIEEKFEIFTKIESITKDEAISWEWGHGKYGHCSIKNLSENTKTLGPPQQMGQQKFLDSSKLREKLHLNSLGINKYYFVSTKENPHPNEL
jgi:hypothetical protein